MEKNPGSQRSSGNLLQVAGFLRQADKLVRERNYTSALDQIARARVKDPNNSYAEAYEQRVKLLLNALNQNIQPRNLSNKLHSEAPHSFSQHLESIANLAILEAHRTASLSLKQECIEKQNNETKRNPQVASIETPPEDGQTTSKTVDQILGSVHLAQELFLRRRFDEALNTLAPAILVDPLNSAILELEHKIHDSQEQEIVSRLLLMRQGDFDFRNVLHEGSLEVQRCILRATQLAEQKEFSKALMVIGEGYLIDPFSEPLALCEKTVLSALGRETRRNESTTNKSRPSRKKREIIQYLDKAEALLDEDQFAESLSQVAMAMIATQRDEDSTEDEPEGHTPLENDSRSSSNRQELHGATDQIENEDPRNIFALIDQAKRLASDEHYAAALDVLLKASSIIPSDGSLEHLDREIARTFMAYFLLAKQGRSKPTNQLTPAPDGASETNYQPVPKSEHHALGTAPKSVRGKQESSKRTDDLFEFENQSSDPPDDRIVRTRQHLMRSLRHLDSMRLVEASVEGEIATLVDDSRKDIAQYASTVSDLVRKAKAHIPIEALNERFNAARHQVTDLVHRLCFEEIMNGIDQVLQVIPENNILLRRREEVDRSFEQFKQSLQPLQDSGSLSPQTASRNATIVNKSKKHPLEQIGLTFASGFETGNEIDASRSDENADVTDAIPAQKSVRKRTSISSTSHYHGN